MLLSFFMIFVLMKVAFEAENVTLLDYSTMSLGILSGTLTTLFHLTSYRYYQENRFINYKLKVSKLLWAGSICFSIYIMYIAASSMISLFYVSVLAENIIFFIVMTSVLIFGLLNILEVALLKKRIAKGKAIQAQMNEMDDIGDINN